jgi:hypothetical protein
MANPCSEANCTALADNGDKCIVHQRYTIARESDHCVLCMRKLKPGKYVMRVSRGLAHVGACPERKPAKATDKAIR